MTLGLNTLGHRSARTGRDKAALQQLVAELLAGLVAYGGSAR
jgi:hypothetical protein